MRHFLSLIGCSCEWLSRAVTFLGVQDNENHVWLSEERILVELNGAVARFLVSLARRSLLWIFGVIRSLELVNMVLIPISPDHDHHELVQCAVGSVKDSWFFIILGFLVFFALFLSKIVELIQNSLFDFFLHVRWFWPIF